MPEQCGLDLARADPEAARFDQVDRFAADDAMHAVAVDHGHVTGAVPAVGAKGLGGGLLLVEVAVEHRRSPNLKAPNGFAVMGHVGAVLVDQPRLDTGHRKAHPAGPRSPSTRVLIVISDSVLP